MKRLLLILALAAPLVAQEEKKEEPPKGPLAQKLFVLKHADPNQVAGLIKIFAVNVTPNSGMHAIAVSASKDAMPAIEEAISRLDVPPAPQPAQPAQQDVDLTLYLIVGSSAADSAATPVPKDLDSVITQMRGAFAYKSYRLQDVQVIRTRTNSRVDTSGIAGAVQIGGVSQPIIAQTSIDSVWIEPPDGRIRINNLRINNRIPVATGAASPNAAGGAVNTQYSYNSVGITANVDLKEGQKIVVGKSGINPDEAMFVVLSARTAQ